MFKKRNTSYLSVILFIISAWFMTFFCWNMIENNNYVSRVINAGTLTFRGNEFDIVGFYMSSSAPYLFYALVTGVLGWILIKINSRKPVCVDEKAPSVVSETIITRTEKE